MISVAVPNDWEYHFPFHSQSNNANSESALSSHALCIIVDSLSPSSTKGIASGEKRRGLLLKSTLLPRLTDVYLQGRAPILAMPVEAGRAHNLLQLPHDRVRTFTEMQDRDSEDSRDRTSEASC